MGIIDMNFENMNFNCGGFMIIKRMNILLKNTLKFMLSQGRLSFVYWERNRKNPIKLGGRRIKNIQINLNAGSTNILNKAGRLVLNGLEDGERIKIYEANTDTHAFFLKNITNDSVISQYFPRTISQQDIYLITEWVHGKTLSDKKGINAMFDKMVDIQTTLHHYKSPYFTETGFCYWEDFIYPRFRRAASLVGEQALANSVYGDVRDYYSSREMILIHPDLTLSNIVKNDKGQLIIIDNELISKGTIPLLDVCNTVYSMNEKNANMYVEKYLIKMSSKYNRLDIDILKKAWLARCIGSFFVAGKMHRMMDMINMYNNNECILPFNDSILNDYIQNGV